MTKGFAARRPGSRPASAQHKAVDRDQLLHSAVRLFRERGYHATSMQSIADDVGILKGSLYHHIQSKEELLIEMLLRSVTELLSVATAVADSPLSPREKLRRMIEAELEAMARHQDEIMIWLAEGRRMRKLLVDVTNTARAVDDLLHGILAEGAEAGEWPKDDLGTLFHAIQGMLVSFPSWYRPAVDNVTVIAHRFSDYAEAMAASNATRAVPSRTRGASR